VEKGQPAVRVASREERKAHRVLLLPVENAVSGGAKVLQRSTRVSPVEPSGSSFALRKDVPPW
jgi:hypothetical protein